MFANHHTDIALPLIRFLVDRIDEDDAALDSLARRQSRGPDDAADFAGVRSVERLRGDLISKRHVIGDLQQLIVLRDLPGEATVRQHAIAALAAMASVYSDHPAFRPEWVAEPTPPPDTDPTDASGPLQPII